MLAACFCLMLTSCGGKTQVAQAASEVESIAADVNEVAESFPENVDMTDANAVKKLDELNEKSQELTEKMKDISNKYAFLKVDNFSGITINEEELAKLSEAEKADAQLLRDAIKQVQEACAKLIAESAKAVTNTLEGMGDTGAGF